MSDDLRLHKRSALIPLPLVRRREAGWRPDSRSGQSAAVRAAARELDQAIAEHEVTWLALAASSLPPGHYPGAYVVDPAALEANSDTADRVRRAWLALLRAIIASLLSSPQEPTPSAAPSTPPALSSPTPARGAASPHAPPRALRGSEGAPHAGAPSTLRPELIPEGLAA